MTLSNAELHELVVEGIHARVAKKVHTFTKILAAIDRYVDSHTDEQKDALFVSIQSMYQVVCKNYETLKGLAHYALCEHVNARLQQSLDGLVPLMSTLDDFIHENDITMRNKTAALISYRLSKYEEIIIQTAAAA